MGKFILLIICARVNTSLFTNQFFKNNLLNGFITWLKSLVKSSKFFRIQVCAIVWIHDLDQLILGRFISYDIGICQPVLNLSNFKNLEWVKKTRIFLFKWVGKQVFHFLSEISPVKIWNNLYFNKKSCKIKPRKSPMT